MHSMDALELARQSQKEKVKMGDEGQKGESTNERKKRMRCRILKEGYLYNAFGK